MPATTEAAARPRSWPAMLAWALLTLELLLFATYPWVDQLLRQAGRPDLKVLAPFAIPLNSTRSLGQILGLSVHAADADRAAW